MAGGHIAGRATAQFVEQKQATLTAKDAAQARFALSRGQQLADAQRLGQRLLFDVGHIGQLAGMR